MGRLSIILVAVCVTLAVPAALAGGVAVHDWAIEVPGGWLGYVEWGSFDPAVTATRGIFYFGPLGQVETSIGAIPVAISVGSVVAALISCAVLLPKRRRRSRDIQAPNGLAAHR